MEETDATGANYLYALDRANGHVEWQHELTTARDHVIGSSLSIHDGVLYVTGETHLYALDPTSGDRQWSLRLGDPYLIDRVGTTLYIQTRFRDGLAAVDLATGDLQWERRDIKTDTPVVVEDNVYVTGSSDLRPSERDVFVLDRASGELRTVVDLPQGAESSLIPYDDSFIVATASPPKNHNLSAHDGHVRRLDATTFEQTWARSAPPVPLPLLAGDESTVFVGGRVDALQALDPEDGTVKWSTPFQNGGIQPTVDDQQLYTGKDDGTLCGFDRATGEQRWCNDRPSDSYGLGRFQQPLVVAGDVLYAPNDDEHLYAVDRMTGELRWQFRTPGGLRAPPVVRDGTVYFTTGRGTVYAIDV